MKKILGLCINLLLFIISDAVPLKLVAGNRSVVKKDGATHTISKYYVVPNDFDPNNFTNSTETSQKTTLRMNHSLYSKSMDANTASENQVSENRAEKQTNENNADVDNIEVNLRSGLNDALDDVATHANDNTAESTDAVPLKLVAGNRSVVKKDGATHTISKYYVVPNDFDPNNFTNSTETSQKTTLRMNHSLYSKSMDANTASENQVSENRAEKQTNENNADVDNIEVNLRSGLNDALDDVATHANDNTAESTGSVNTELSLDHDGLGNLQVEPINHSINTNSSVTINEINVYNSSEALQNGTSFIVENATQTFERNVEDELNDLILTKFGIAVQESSVQNLESFWKLVKLTKDTISDDDKLLAKIERLSLLLNIFTNLYEAAQLQKPTESMIDSIIDILQIPFVEKSNTSESQSKTDVSGDYDEECLRKCDLKRSRAQLDSNGTCLSGTESLEASDNLELEKLALQRRQRGEVRSDDDWVNTSNDPVSNQVTVSNQPTNILRSQLLVPNNLNVDVPDGYNVRSPIPTPTLNHVTRNNDIQKDPKSNQSIPDSVQTSENTDDHPLTIESRLTDDLPWTIEDKSIKNLPWTIQTTTTDDLPWHIEDKTIDHQPWIIEHRTTNTLPWTIEDRGTKKVAWNVENRADPISGTVHGVNKGIKKPYHIYTYVINPATSLYEIPNSGNIVKVKSTQPNAKLGTKLYRLSTSHGGNKVVYNNNPSSSYYESPFSLSKPTVDISRPSNSQLKHTNYVTFDISNEVNPSTLISETPQDDYQPQYLVGHKPETNRKPTVLQPNKLSVDSQTNSDQAQPGDLPIVPSNPFESLKSLGNIGPVFTASASASADTNDVNPIQQTNLHPGVISKAQSHSEYTNLPDDFVVPSPVYGGHTNKHPGLIATSSSSSAYTNLPDDFVVPSPDYGGHTNKHPGLIATSSSSSAYTNLPDDFVVPSPVYSGHTNTHPGLIATSSSSSAYTNLPDEYDEPVYGGQTHERPVLISSSNSEYKNVADDYDEPNPVYGGQTHKYPGFISKASAYSEYTNLPNYNKNPIPDYEQHTDINRGLMTKVNHYPEYANIVDDYDEPIHVYGGEYDKPVYSGQAHQRPGLISSSNSEYTNVADHYDEPNPVYGGQTHEHPGFLSNASSNSEYTNLPNDYNPTDNYEKDTDRYPVQIKTPVNGRPIENEDSLLVSYHPYGHTEHTIRPSLIAHLHGKQPTGLNYLKHLKLELAPSYRLFTLDNLLKLHDVVFKTIEVNGDELDVYDNKALVNLRKIINIILILAEHLEEPEGSIEWYEKIFYNTHKNRHPLEIYVYNLIRQRWLHELMLVLHKNDFNFNILQNPRILSFLSLWQFPNYVLNFMAAKELKQHNFDAPEVFDQTFSSQHGLHDKFATHTYDDLMEEVPQDLENYVTNKVMNSYKTPNTGIVLSIAGVEAEPDANAIIHILEKYLHYKSFIEKQENVIIRDNKVEMLKQIILFLREKGYGATTIADLIRKLYTAVYSIEGKDCQTHHTNFAKNMYDVILPVLRRSGR